MDTVKGNYLLEMDSKLNEIDRGKHLNEIYLKKKSNSQPKDFG